MKLRLKLPTGHDRRRRRGPARSAPCRVIAPGPGPLKHRPNRIVYLSCDLGDVRLADAGRLRAVGYLLERVTPLDFFPQTFHIETLSSRACS